MAVETNHPRNIAGWEGWCMIDVHILCMSIQSFVQLCSRLVVLKGCHYAALRTADLADRTNFQSSVHHEYVAFHSHFAYCHVSLHSCLLMHFVAFGVWKSGCPYPSVLGAHYPKHHVRTC